MSTLTISPDSTINNNLGLSGSNVNTALSDSNNSTFVFLTCDSSSGTYGSYQVGFSNVDEIANTVIDSIEIYLTYSVNSWSANNMNLTTSVLGNTEKTALITHTYTSTDIKSSFVTINSGSETWTWNQINNLTINNTIDTNDVGTFYVYNMYVMINYHTVDVVPSSFNIKPRIDGEIKSYNAGWVRVDGSLKTINNIWTRVDGVLKTI